MNDEPIPLPDQQQQQNLRTLADYALSGRLKARFSMRVYADDEHLAFGTHCGSVGCMVGHGPYAGMPKLLGETWLEYARFMFGVHNEFLFAHLFDSDWVHYDNTPEGAGRRILGVLEQIERGTLTKEYLIENTPFLRRRYSVTGD